MNDTDMRQARDWWMERANFHALESDRFRVETINLKGRIYELEIRVANLKNDLATAQRDKDRALADARYERARADLYDHDEELRQLREQLALIKGNPQ